MNFTRTDRARSSRNNLLGAVGVMNMNLIPNRGFTDSRGPRENDDSGLHMEQKVRNNCAEVYEKDGGKQKSSEVKLDFIRENEIMTSIE